MDLFDSKAIRNTLEILNKTKVKTNSRSTKQNPSAQSTSNSTGVKKRTSAKK